MLGCQCSYGDGWHGGYVEIGGLQYCGDFKMGHSQSEPAEMLGKPMNIATYYHLHHPGVRPSSELVLFVFSYLDYVCMDITTITRRYGNETRWTFGFCNSDQVYDDYKEYHEMCCQPAKAYTLDCEGVDGWHRGYISVGLQYCGDFRIGEHQRQKADMIGKLINVTQYPNLHRLCVL